MIEPAIPVDEAARLSTLRSLNIPIHEKRVTALIGPSGCGKSTFVRSFNRMHDLYPGNRYVGERK